MSKKMESFEFTIFILLFSVIHQILSDNPVFACTLADESYVPKEYRLKRSHADAFEKNAEKRDEATKSQMQGATKYQTPRTKTMNLCIGEPKRRRTIVPIIQTKATATVSQQRNVATIIPTNDSFTGTIVRPKVSNTATNAQQKPFATIQPKLVPIIQPIIPTVSIVQPKCVSNASVIQPNVVSSTSASIQPTYQPETTATATITKPNNGTFSAKHVEVPELSNYSTIHNVNTISETDHAIRNIHENCNDSLKKGHHYIVDIPSDNHLNNTSSIHHGSANQIHSVNSGEDSKSQENDAFYVESSNKDKMFHTVSKDTFNAGKTKTAAYPKSNRTLAVVVKNKSDTHKIFSSNDRPVILETVTPKPNKKQGLSDILKRVQLLSTPKPLKSGTIGDITAEENNLQENSLDKIKLEPNDDIVFDRFDVEEVKESYRNPSDYTNKESSTPSGWCIYPSIDNQGMQSTSGGIMSYDGYLNYYNNGCYKDNSRGAYSYLYNNYATPALKTMIPSKVVPSILKDRIWRKWSNTQIYLRRPAHENASPKVKSTSWSQEQKIPVIGYNAYYTNQNCCNCS